MPDPADPSVNQVRFARRLIIHRPGQPDEHGIEFPSGHIIADHPGLGLIAYAGPEFAIEDVPGAAVEYCPDDPQATP